MVQNHMLQLLVPGGDGAAGLRSTPTSIRDEKVKVLRSLRPIGPREVAARSPSAASTTRGCTTARPSPAIARKTSVAPGFAHRDVRRRCRFDVDNWRWAGVPFYLRTGKALAKQFAEIAIIYKRPPACCSPPRATTGSGAIRCCIRIQPNEGISISINAKVPGNAEAEFVEMGFSTKAA